MSSTCIRPSTKFSSSRVWKAACDPSLPVHQPSSSRDQGWRDSLVGPDRTGRQVVQLTLVVGLPFTPRPPDRTNPWHPTLLGPADS